MLLYMLFLKVIIDQDKHFWAFGLENCFLIHVMIIL